MPVTRPTLPDGFIYAFDVRYNTDIVYWHRDGRAFWEARSIAIDLSPGTRAALEAGIRHKSNVVSLRPYTRLTNVLFRPAVYACD